MPQTPVLLRVHVGGVDRSLSLHIAAGEDALEQVPPFGALGRPVRGDLVDVAQVLGEHAVLGIGFLLGAGEDIAEGRLGREVSGSISALRALNRIVANELDELLRSLNLGSVFVGEQSGSCIAGGLFTPEPLEKSILLYIHNKIKQNVTPVNASCTREIKFNIIRYQG